MDRISRRGFIRNAAAGVLGAAAALAAGCGPRQERVNFFNWFNYIGKDTVPNFEKETGIKIHSAVYSSEEEMFSKLKAGVRGYDLIVATDYMVPRLKALQLIEPIPHELIPNLSNISKRFSDPVYDPGLHYTVPYLWGTTGIGYSRTKLPAAPTSWWDLWNEKHQGRISMLDHARDTIETALLLLKLPVDTKDPEHLRKAKELLIKQRPLLKQYSSSTYVDGLTSGEIWLAQGWSGDVLQAARESPAIDYVIPKEGSLIWVDSLCVMRGSQNRPAALRFIDYLLRAEVAAEIANTVRYATPNQAARRFLDPSLANDTRVFPGREVESRLKFGTPLDEEADELWNQVWQEVKVG